MGEYSEVVKNVMTQVRAANVDAVFGQSRQMGENLVIPVGKVSYGFGGGAGKGETEHGKREIEQEGGGMGMGVRVKPIGYIHATSDRVYYRPIVDRGMILTILGFFAGLAMTGLVRQLSRQPGPQPARGRLATVAALPDRLAARVRSALRKAA